MATKFYTFDQNNSGGFFDCDEDLSEFVIIEAESAEDANDKAKEIGIYFDGVADGRDGPCCGDRWYPVGESVGTDEPEVLGVPAHEKRSFIWSSDITIHYLDGRVEQFTTKE